MRFFFLFFFVVVLAILGCEKSQENRKPAPPGGRQAKLIDPEGLASDKKREDATEALRRGLVFFERNDFDAAIAAFSEAIRLDPSMAGVFNSRGRAWQKKGQYDKAIEDFDEAIRLDREKSFAPYINRGNAWRDKKQYDKAIADFNKAIELAPDNAAGFNARGNAWCEKGQYDKGIADLSEAIRLDPNFAAAFSVRASLWDPKKEQDKAIADYTEAIRLEPTAKRYGGRAGVWARHKKDKAKAIADWTEAIRLDPMDRDSMLFAVNFLAKAGDANVRDGKRALELAKKAFALDNEDSLGLIMMAAAYAEIGDFEEAVRWQQKVVQHPQTLDRRGHQIILTLYQNKQPHRLAE